MEHDVPRLWIEFNEDIAYYGDSRAKEKSSAGAEGSQPGLGSPFSLFCEKQTMSVAVYQCLTRFHVNSDSSFGEMLSELFLNP